MLILGVVVVSTEPSFSSCPSGKLKKIGLGTDVGESQSKKDYMESNVG